MTDNKDDNNGAPAEPMNSEAPNTGDGGRNEELNVTQLVAVTTSPQGNTTSKINPENAADFATGNPKVDLRDVSQDIEEIDKLNESQVMKMGLLKQPSDNKIEIDQKT